MILVALLTSAVCLAVADPPAGRKFALLVGVNEFQSRQLPPLAFAVNDATETAQVLSGLGYRVTLLTDDTPTKPTRANIDAALKAVLREAKRSDTVLIGLSAHGLQFGSDKQKGAYLCPADAVPRADRTDTLLPVSDLYRELDDSAAGVRVLLVDACRNDPAAPPAGRTRSGVAAAITAAVPPTGVAALYSCSVGQESLEHPEIKHGVFFHHVIEGLKGGAAGADGEVTFYGLAEYVSRRVGKTAARLQPGHVQTPNPRADLQGEPPVLAVVKGPPTRTAPAGGGWADLLAGDRLDAWSKLGGGRWSVRDGVLSLTPAKRERVVAAGALATVAEFTDYELELEYRLPAGGNTGVLLRCWKGATFTGSDCVELQLLDDAGYPNTAWPNGAVVKQFRPVRTVAAPAGQWNRVAVQVVGRQVTASINDNRCQDREIDLVRPTGCVGLHAWDTSAEFRNVRVRPLAR